MLIIRAIIPILLLFQMTFAEERHACTTSNITGSPEAPMPYMAEAVWPHNTFNEGLDITLLESEQKMFASEHEGKIWILPDDLGTQPKGKILIADMKGFIANLLRLLGLAFHPKFEKNRIFFVY